MTASLDLSIDEVLSTTRSVRKRLDFDRPVEMSVLRECLSLAIQAPTGSNRQAWHFVLVTDRDRREALAGLYRTAFENYIRSDASKHGWSTAGDPTQHERVLDSAGYLAAHLQDAPVLLIPCVEGQFSQVAAGPTIAASVYASILPAFWSFMLAARARGLGTCLTTMHLAFAEEAAAIVGIDHGKIMQCGLTPVAYTRGVDFKPAARRPLDEVLHVNTW